MSKFRNSIYFSLWFFRAETQNSGTRKAARLEPSSGGGGGGGGGGSRGSIRSWLGFVTVTPRPGRCCLPALHCLHQPSQPQPHQHTPSLNSELILHNAPKCWEYNQVGRRPWAGQLCPAHQTPWTWARPVCSLHAATALQHCSTAALQQRGKMSRNCEMSQHSAALGTRQPCTGTMWAGSRGSNGCKE